MTTNLVRIGLAMMVLGLGFLPLVVFWSRPNPQESVPPPKPPYVYTPPKGYVCYRAASPVTIDGRLDDAAWDAAPWSDDFVDIEGDVKPRPRFRTRVKMLWDDQALYIAAEMEEPHVWGTLREHDSVIFHDNDFEVFLDPDGDGQLYGELELNVLNTTWDLLLSKPYKDGGRAVNAWEITDLKTAVHVDGTVNDPRDQDRGWSVEIAWPWKGIKELTTRKVPPRDGDQWRINFSRVEWEHEIAEGKYRKVGKKQEDNWVWSPQGLIDMHRPERWGYLQFSTAAPGSVPFHPDADQAVRHQLHQVYYAQRDYRKVHGRWADSTAQLGLADIPARIEVTSTTFEASLPSASGRRWSIDASSRVWVE